MIERDLNNGHLNGDLGDAEHAKAFGSTALTPEYPEAQMAELKEAAKRCEEEGLRKLEERHVQEVPKRYHKPEHSKILKRNSEADLNKLKQFAPGLVKETDIVAAGLVAISHDRVLNENFPEADREVIGKTVARNRGFYAGDFPAGVKGNERLSADELMADMEKDSALNKLLENYGYREKILAAFAATYPKVEFEGEEIRFSQPYNKPNSDMLTFVVAINDLCAAYRNDAKQDKIVNDGNAEWLELNRPITNRVTKAFQEAAGSGQSPESAVSRAFSQEERRVILNSIMGWKRAQVAHVKFQQVEFNNHLVQNKAIQSLQADVQKAVMDYFKNKFDGGQSSPNSFAKGIALTRTVYGDYETKYGKIAQVDDATFIDLLKSMGLEIG